MANNAKSGSSIQVTEADMALLQAARARKEREEAYRKVRNQRPEVKLKNAEYHAKRNAELRGFHDAFQHMLDCGMVTEEMLTKLEHEVPSYAEYVIAYVKTEEKTESK